MDTSILVALIGDNSSDVGEDGDGWGVGDPFLADGSGVFGNSMFGDGMPGAGDGDGFSFNHRSILNKGRYGH